MSSAKKMHLNNLIDKIREYQASMELNSYWTLQKHLWIIITPPNYQPLIKRA